MVIKPVSTATVTEGIERQLTVERHLSLFTLGKLGKYDVIVGISVTSLPVFPETFPSQLWSFYINERMPCLLNHPGL